MKTLPAAAALLFLATGAAQAIAQESSSCSAHHAGVDSRGDHVMGFDHDKTTHHFRLTRTGGAIEVSANDPKDADSRDAIRGHLTHIAQMFAQGDFEAPMLIHDQVPPGVPILKEKKSVIHWNYERTENGGRIVVSTADEKALSAVHEFLRFQIDDHETGDPVTIAN
jgi:hypothetical protein